MRACAWLPPIHLQHAQPPRRQLFDGQVQPARSERADAPSEAGASKQNARKGKRKTGMVLDEEIQLATEIMKQQLADVSGIVRTLADESSSQPSGRPQAPQSNRYKV